MDISVLTPEELDAAHVGRRVKLTVASCQDTLEAKIVEGVLTDVTSSRVGIQTEHGHEVVERGWIVMVEVLT